MLVLHYYDQMAQYKFQRYKLGKYPGRAWTHIVTVIRLDGIRTQLCSFSFRSYFLSFFSQ